MCRVDLEGEAVLAEEFPTMSCPVTVMLLVPWPAVRGVVGQSAMPDPMSEHVSVTVGVVRDQPLVPSGAWLMVVLTAGAPGPNWMS